MPIAGRLQGLQDLAGLKDPSGLPCVPPAEVPKAEETEAQRGGGLPGGTRQNSHRVGDPRTWTLCHGDGLALKVGALGPGLPPTPWLSGLGEHRPSEPGHSAGRGSVGSPEASAETSPISRGPGPSAEVLRQRDPRLRVHCTRECVRAVSCSPRAAAGDPAHGSLPALLQAKSQLLGSIWPPGAGLAGSPPTALPLPAKAHQRPTRPSITGHLPHLNATLGIRRAQAMAVPAHLGHLSLGLRGPSRVLPGLPGRRHHELSSSTGPSRFPPHRTCPCHRPTPAAHASTRSLSRNVF